MGDGKLLDTTVINSPGTLFKGSQYTESESHPDYRRGLTDLVDYGGPFFSQRRYIDGFISPNVIYRGSRRIGSGGPSDQLLKAYYEGPMLPVNLNPNSWPPYINSDDDTLDEVGASLIARCLPTNSPADVSQFLGEILIGGLPKLAGSAWKKATSKAKAAGDEYLNARYGWEPIANDIGSFFAAVYTADITMRQFERDVGKVVRRGFRFPMKTSQDTGTFREGESPWTPISSGGMFGPNTGQGKVLKRRVENRSQWFSGAFTYYLPRGYKSRSEMGSRADMVRHTLGLRLTPDVVWELSPWSWAVDWFSNVGDVFHNVSAFAEYGLVMRYGYVMEHSEVRDTYIFSGETGLTNPITVPTFTMVAETKVRRQANPFGFGVDWSGLSPFQLSIAAALGLSNSGRGKKR